MTTTEFSIDMDANEEGLGQLIVTDAELLVRPRRVPGKYPASVKHDTDHAYNIMALGNDRGAYTTHIFCREGIQAAHQLLDRVFYAFVDACCLQLWCDARVYYYEENKSCVVREYGFEDGNYTINFTVHCGVTDADALLDRLTADLEEAERYIVVRPDASESGYAVRGFEIPPDDDSFDEGDSLLDDYEDPYAYEEDEEDEDPLAGDVEPTGGYYEEPMHTFEAQRLSVMRQHGDYTG